MQSIAVSCAAPGSVVCIKAAARRSPAARHALPLPNPRQNGTDALGKGVFQTSSALPPSKLQQVEDAMESCSLTQGQERRQCFEVFGLDADSVDRYYPTVACMERSIVEEDQVGYRVVTSGGAGLLWVIAACLMRGG